MVLRRKGRLWRDGVIGRCCSYKSNGRPKDGVKL